VSGTFEIPFDTLNGSKSVLIIPATFEPQKEVRWRSGVVFGVVVQAPPPSLSPSTPVLPLAGLHVLW
jgi:hypothetical protein